MTPERKKRLEKVLEKRQPDITVVLENVTDPHNISAVMRTCDAIGIQDLYILNTFIPVHKKWGKKSSSSAAKWLTIHQYTETRACMAALREHYDMILATKLAGDAVSLYDTDLTRRTALIFGNEHAGISDDISQLADGHVVIPQVGIIQSLNISVACAISLYEAFRQKSAAGHYAGPRIGPAHRDRVKAQWGIPD